MAETQSTMFLSFSVNTECATITTSAQPDALKCPGVRRGRRYVSSGEISETSGGKTDRIARRIYTTIYEIDSPGATTTPEFQAMRGWYHFAPHVRSRTQVIVPVG